MKVILTTTWLASVYMIAYPILDTVSPISNIGLILNSLVFMYALIK